MPDPNLIARHFAPSVEIQTRSERCVHYESRSSVGPESLIGVTLGVGLVAAQVVPPIMASFGQAKRAQCAADLNSLNSAVMMYAMKNGGEFPDSLVRLVEPDANGRRYLQQTIVPKDPWGTTYQYSPAEGASEHSLWSCGPDGIDNQGQGDDITVKAVHNGNW